jgi:Cu(I)/Ag(I) efflux system membrane fusion protein
VPVRKGQTLYTIYSEQLAALQQEYLVSLAQVTAFPDDDKFRQLADGARQKLLLYGQTEGQLQQLRNKKQTSPFISYASPVDGVVAEMFVTEGQYVGEGSAIMRVEGYSNIWVEADLYPAEASLVKKGDRVNVSIAGSNMEPQVMRVEFIAPALQTGSQLLTIRGSISNPGNQFKAGMQALVEIPVANTSSGITLPVDAIIRDENGAHVWKEISAGKFVAAMVETGADNINRVEILKGITAGDVVVTSGAYLLYSEFVLKKGKNPMAGHNH